MTRLRLARWAKHVYTRCLTRWRADFTLPDADALLDRLRPDLDLPTLARRLRRWNAGGAGAQSLQSLLDRLQADAAWPRLSRWIDRVYGDQDWKRLRLLAQRLHPEIELPELPVSLSSQHRQALRGLLLLGVVLHSNPVPLRAPASAPGLAGPAVAQVHDVTPVIPRAFNAGPTRSLAERSASDRASAKSVGATPGFAACQPTVTWPRLPLSRAAIPDTEVRPGFWCRATTPPGRAPPTSPFFS